MIAIDVGPYALGVESTDLRGVELDVAVSKIDAIDTGASSTGNSVAGLVRYGDSAVTRAVDLGGWLNVTQISGRRSMILVRTPCSLGHEDSLGLFVDSTSRPLSVNRQHWLDIPAWVTSRLTIPGKAWVTHHDRGSVTPRVILDTAALATNPVAIDEASVETLTEGVTRTRNATNSEATGCGMTTGRGLLVFAPAESSRVRMNAALAVPMSCVVHIGSPTPIRQVPTCDPSLMGLTIWNDRPLPVMRLGDALGLAAEDRSKVPDKESSRLLVVRTPNNELLGCLTHAQMRSLRTPTSSTPHPQPGIDARWLLGAFITDEGPMAVPDLDQVILSGHLPIQPGT
ncbi:MAG: CheW domain-containing protein [Planctomycetota bacterium]